jgi:Carboxypeptidase regulatory-like domain
MHKRFLWIIAVCLTLSTQLFSQGKTTGTIAGTVADPTGALISGAQITITNVATGDIRKVTSNASGEFQLPELPIGIYQVRVRQTGFREYVATGVGLHVDSTATINATLQLGDTNEQVTVEASTIQVQTDSAALGEVVEGDQVRNLPLNARNFVALTQLAPGVAAARTFNAVGKGLAGGVDFAVNGNSMTDNLFLVDGANNNDVGSNRTILIYPSLDSIAEFKMVRNSYGPEYGQAGGGVINIVTKGGTNQWHGSVFYSGRNDKLDAYDWFSAQNAVNDRRANTFNPVTNSIYSSPNQDKPILRHNDWGYNLGGPIKKDKLFFFWNQEWNHEIRSVYRQGCVPTAAERKGDFSAGTSCGQVISATGLTGYETSPESGILASPMQGMLDYMGNFPLPNQSNAPALTAIGGVANPAWNGFNNWKANLSSAVRWREENIRGDYNLTKRHTIMFKYTQDNWTNPAPVLGYWGDDAFPQLESNWAQPSKSIVGKLTSTIGSNLINTAAFSYSNNRIIITPGGTTPNLVQTLTTDFPTLFPENLKTHKYGEPIINLGPNSPQMIAPWNNGENLYNARDDLSWIHGNHTIKIGMFLGFNAKFEDNGGGSSERLNANTADSYAPVKTGDPLANAFIPQTFSGLSETSTDINNDMRWRDYEWYVGDTWKVNRKLSLDLGLRYSIYLTPYQINGLMTNFQPSLYNPALPASDACNGLWIVPGTNPCINANNTFGTSFGPGVKGPNKYLKDQNYHQFAPRIGLAYDLFGNGNTAIRAGFGQFYQRDRSAIYTLSSNAPFALNANGITRALNGASYTASQFSTASVSPDGGFDPSNTTPYSLQWNVSVEHSFAKETTLELAYVGNRSVHQLTTSDINEVPQSSWAACSFMSNCNSLRPYPNYGFLTWWAHYGDAHYNALQALFKTRVQRATINLTYTFSKSFGDVPMDESNGTANYQTLNLNSNPSLDRGNTQINRPNIFVANVIYPLPELRGANPILRGVAGGWQLATILSAQNGPSTTMYQAGLSENLNLLASPACTSTNPNLPAGCDPNAGKLNALYGTGNGGPPWAPGSNRRPFITGTSCNSGSHNNYVYNSAAFTVVGHQIGEMGNEPQGFCQGPNFFNDDFSLKKTWKVTEKVNLQFALDAFNLFNHPNFNPNSSNNAIGAVNCGAPNGSGKYQACAATNNVITTALPGGDLHQTGVIANSEREIQYGLKVIF